MTTIFEALRADHDVQRALIGDLVETTGAEDRRRDLFAQLVDELAAHANAEERHFYAPLMEHDQTQDKARHSVAEHKELDDYIERLQSYEMTAPQWLQTAEKLADRLVHHLDEEEHEVFQVAGKVLDDDQKTGLADAYREQMDDERSTRV